MSKSSLDSAHDILARMSAVVKEGLEPTLVVRFNNGLSEDLYAKLQRLGSPNILVWKQCLYVGAIRDHSGTGT